MSEEEKKAIEYLKENSKEGSSFWCYEAIPNFKKILKFLEKQQKEIEELKQENKEHIEVITEWVNGERINDIKHISKDKIRKKIKELKNIIEFETPSYKETLEYTIDILKELLEE